MLRPADAAVVVLTTLANEDEAVALVRSLLDRRLVACGTVLPAGRSLYQWEGKVVDEQEVVVLLKTTEGRRPGLGRAVHARPPYLAPSARALSVSGCPRRFLSPITT